jgi:RHS repeat-associated protein
VTDSNKTIIAASTSHPFGETEVEEGSEHYHYTGKEKNSIGLHYYGARYYDPETGRFITRDNWTFLPNDFRSFGGINKHKIIDSQIFNRYSYCRNNPLIYIDPNGHGWLGKIFSAILVEIALVLLVISFCALIGATGGLAAPLAIVILSYISYGGSVLYFVSEWFIKKEEEGYKYHDLNNAEGEFIGRLWISLETDSIIGGYFWDAESNCWMVFNSETGEYEPVPEGQWSPPNTDEPVTIQKFPPKDPEPDPPNSLNSGINQESSSTPQGGTQAGPDNYAI